MGTPQPVAASAKILTMAHEIGSGPEVADRSELAVRAELLAESTDCGPLTRRSTPRSCRLRSA